MIDFKKAIVNDKYYTLRIRYVQAGYDCFLNHFVGPWVVYDGLYYKKLRKPLTAILALVVGLMALLLYLLDCNFSN